MERPPSNSPLPPLPTSVAGESPSLGSSRGAGEGSASPAVNSQAGLGTGATGSGPGGLPPARSPYQSSTSSLPRMSNILNPHHDSNNSTPAPPNPPPSGSPSASFPRLPPLPSLSSSASSASHRNPMSVASMVSPTQSNRAPPSNPLERSAGPSLDPLPRIPDFVRRPAGAGSPDISTRVQLPGSATAKPPGAQSPPRPGQPSLHSQRSASSVSATAAPGSAQAGSSQGAGAGGRGGYPPLPSAFARENPYSPWPPKARTSDGQQGGGQAQAGGAGSPPSQSHGLPQTQQQSGTPSSSFGGYGRPSANQPHSQPSHQHSHSAQSHSQPPAQPQPSRQSGSPYAPSHAWGPSPAQAAAQQPPLGGGDYYSRAGYGPPAGQQHSGRPGVATQKSDPSAGGKAPGQSPRFGASGSMAGQPPASSATASLYGQPTANGHHQEPYPSRQGSDPNARAASAGGPNGSLANGHKRRRSEHAAPVRQPPTAPFTLAQQRQAEIRPPLLKIDSAPVLASVPAPAGGRPHLGRRVYCPFTEPAQLLSGDLLRNGVGGVIEVAVPVSILEGAKWQIGDPEEYTGEDEAEIVPEVWELDGLRKRKVWGTDIYTDDSDVLGLALHSGWLRLSPGDDKADEAQARVQTLLIKLLVVPALIRYQGCTRQGLRSRSWGNGHEGVSLMVTGIEALEEKVAARGRRHALRRVDENAKALLAEEVAELETFVLAPWAEKDQKGPAEAVAVEVAMEA